MLTPPAASWFFRYKQCLAGSYFCRESPDYPIRSGTGLARIGSRSVSTDPLTV